MNRSKVRQNSGKPLRLEILNVVREMLLKDGYNNLSMRRLATVIGYSPTTIYNYFKNKDDIIFNLCNDYFSRLADTLIKSVDEADSPEEKIKKCMMAYIRFGLDDPDSYHIAFMMNLSDENGFSFVEKGSNGMQAYDFITKTASEIFDMPEIAAQTLWNMAHGIVSNMIMNRHFPWAEQEILINTAADALIAGLKRSSK